MWKAILFVAVGLVLLGAAGLAFFPDLRTDILERIADFGFGGGDKQVTLTYWGMWEPREVMQPLIDEYQQQHPNITIEYEMRDPENYYETLVSRLGSEGAPDIIRVHSTWIPFLQDQLLALPSRVMSVEEYESTFLSVNQLQKTDGNYYGIPLMIDGLALVYNRDLFLEEGIANPPTTWNELREYSGRLTKLNSNGDLVQSGAALGYSNNIDHFSDIIGLMFAQSYVPFVDASGSVAFDKAVDPVTGVNLAAEALKFYTLFGTSERSWDPTWRNSTDEFIAGKVAMILVPSHRLHQILAASPSFEVRVSKTPQLPLVGEADSVYWANYWVESVSRASANGTEAWEFLKWMSEKEQLTKFYQLASQVRSFGEPYPRADMASSLSAETYVMPYVQQGNNYTTWLFTSGTYNSQINDRIIDALSYGVELATGDDAADPASAIQNTANQIQSILLELKAVSN